jgi:hypothetical protein
LEWEYRPSPIGLPLNNTLAALGVRLQSIDLPLDIGFLEVFLVQDCFYRLSLSGSSLVFWFSGFWFLISILGSDSGLYPAFDLLCPTSLSFFFFPFSLICVSVCLYPRRVSEYVSPFSLSVMCVRSWLFIASLRTLLDEILLFYS